MKISTILLVHFVCQQRFIVGEVFSATSDLESLLDTWHNDLEILDKYITNEEKRFNMLKRKFKIYLSGLRKAREDPHSYLNVPINAYTLIKRLVVDMKSIEDGIQIGKEYIGNRTNNSIFKYPTTDDLYGAAEGINRLQKTYHLKAKDLAEGKILGISYSEPMSASDCFELAVALPSQDRKNGLDWMMEALRKYDADTEYFISKAKIVEYIAHAYHVLGDSKSALEWTYKLLEVDPKHAQAPQNIAFYKNNASAPKIDMENSTTISINNTADALCRGEIKVPIKDFGRLQCRYLTDDHPFLKIAPIKMEQLYKKPDIFLFHHIISAFETEKLKNLARPLLRRARVYSVNSTTKETKDRISKNVWLKDSQDEVVAKLSRRLADATGLDLSYSEMIQINNYGIGGHYSAHLDVLKNYTLNPRQLPRIATVLIYLSDVPLGGATVFPKLNLRVSPSKNTAVFWRNVDTAGDTDLLTLHAACPVLVGSKWVANKWIHFPGQEFKKPCDPVEYREKHDIK